MKSLVLALCVALLGGCGNKNPPPDPEVDRYINQELAPHFAKILAARAGYDDINASYIETPENLPNLTHRLTDAGYPFLTQALDGLQKITPPASVNSLHEDLVSIVKEEKEAIGMMSKALDPVDEVAFKKGHERMMAMQESIFRWEKNLQAALFEHGVKMKPLPDVDIPKRRALPPTPAAAAKPEPLPCEPGTEVKQGEVIVECTTTKAMHGLCNKGRTTFHDTGKPKTCTTDLMFVPPEASGTSKDETVLCGPGQLALDPEGVVVGCTIVSDVMVGGTKLAKGATVKLAKGKVVSAELPDGKVFTAPP